MGAPYGEVLNHTRMLVKLSLQLFKADCTAVVRVSVFKQGPSQLIQLSLTEGQRTLVHTGLEHNTQLIIVNDAIAYQWRVGGTRMGAGVSYTTGSGGHCMSR